MVYTRYLSALVVSILLSLQTVIVEASCFNQYYTFTEVLANQADTKHIFTCKVLATYISSRDGYTSIAVVKDRFRGDPQDTVYVTSGGFTSARGEKMPVGSTWLIISDVKYNQQYSATICENLSQRLSDGGSSCTSDRAEFGEEYLSLINLFRSLEELKFTGIKEFIYDGEVRAIGEFLDGKPHGKWKHYASQIGGLPDLLMSEVSYQYGVKDGLETRFDRTSKKVIIESQKMILDGKIQWKKSNRNLYSYYDYSNRWHTSVTNFDLSSEGDTLGYYSTIEFPLDVDNTERLWYYHGPFKNAAGGVSNKIETGNYFKGAKVGNWLAIDLKTNEKTIYTYSFPDTTNENVIAFDASGLPAIEGKFRNNRLIGSIKYLSAGRLEGEWKINERHKLISRKRYWNGNRILVSPYKNGLKNGIECEYDSLNRLTSQTGFQAGIKEGEYVIYDDKGVRTYVSNFNNGRETTLYSITDGYIIKNGFIHGGHTQINANSKRVISRSTYWMGYLVGKYLSYKEDGGYSISYYPTDHTSILEACHNNGIVRTEYYDTDGKLTRIFPE